MSDASEKPFEPTPHRIRKARREGNVARSSEFGANCSFAAGALALAAVAPVLGVVTHRAFVAAARQSVKESWLIVAVALLPIAAASIAGAFGNLLQNGGLMTVAIGPQFGRINPFEGIKRILSRETAAHSLRSFLAFICAVGAMAPFFAWGGSVVVQATTLNDVAVSAWSAARGVMTAACIVGFAFAVAEYGAARGTWLRRLRMSFDERKREAREEEGDAITRGRRRALHRSVLRGGLRALSKAAFVVANPEHVAIALQYRPPEIPVPRVLVRAADSLAMRVRAAAKTYGIPVVENVWLARALYRDARAGEAIPHVHYVAVAEVVSALLRANEIAG
ncbi:MAG: EscU/YscU/HrcU family type III secretion system export apparatus switch protein [Candidatus Eremiobacteraeota bacterium]|nr:EscU/YscU/HrcU family type III secretion system export apparatus switch protein [Candidatus Eremiobacteraeota bacterium]